MRWLLLLTLLTGCPSRSIGPGPLVSPRFFDNAPARPSSQVIVPLGGGIEYGYPGGYQQRIPLGGGSSVVIPR